MSREKPIISVNKKGFQFDPSTNPPTFLVSNEFVTNLEHIKVKVMHSIEFQNYGTYNMNYVGSLILENGKKQIDNLLVFDSDILNLLYRTMLSNNQNDVSVTLSIRIYHDVLGNYFSVDTIETRITINDIEKSMQSTVKLDKQNPRILEPAKIDQQSLYLTLNTMQHKPTLLLSEKVIDAIIKTIKEDILASDEFKKLAVFEDVVKMTEQSGFDLNWVKTAVLLSLHEVVLKNWLKRHGVSEDEISEKQFHTLIDILRKLLTKNGIEFPLKDLAKLSGDRIFRNGVLHEGYLPKDPEVKEVEKETRELLNFLDKHKDININ